MVVRRNFIHIKQGLGIADAGVFQHSCLKCQERRALSEENRKCTQGCSLNAVVAVGARAFIRKTSHCGSKGADHAIETELLRFCFLGVFLRTFLFPIIGVHLPTIYYHHPKQMSIKLFINNNNMLYHIPMRGTKTACKYKKDHAYPVNAESSHSRRMRDHRLNTGEASENLQTVRIPSRCVSQSCLSKKLLKTQ